uniref:Uncharacterized protein n=1 Tax=Arundo donax TaxID=35708 RepID=A0A0A9BKE1_ARUDO
MNQILSSKYCAL